MPVVMLFGIELSLLLIGRKMNHPRGNFVIDNRAKDTQLVQFVTELPLKHVE